MPELKRRKSQKGDDGRITWEKTGFKAQGLGLNVQMAAYRSQGAGAKSPAVEPWKGTLSVQGTPEK